MNKYFLTLGVIFLVSQSANAGLLSTFFGNNDYYYPRYNTKYYPQNYYNPYQNRYYAPNRYYNNFYPQNYYYQQPIINRTTVTRKKSSIDSGIKLVSNTTNIKSLEKQIFNRSFDNDLEKNRIERLEEKIFGTIQKGDLEERLFVLKSAAKNYKTFAQNPYENQQYRPPIFTGTMGGGWRNNMLGNLRNQLTGTPTGFTPAMDPAYMDYFEAERYGAHTGEEVDFRSNTGYYNSRTNRGAKTGVTILD